MKIIDKPVSSPHLILQSLGSPQTDKEIDSKQLSTVPKVQHLAEAQLLPFSASMQD